MKLYHHLADGIVDASRLWKGVRERRQGRELGGFNVDFENVPKTQERRQLSVFLLLSFGLVGFVGWWYLQVFVAVHLHEILDGVEGRVLGCVGVAADADLHEMCAVSVRGIELLAKINHREVVGPYYAVSAGKHFVFC